MAKKNPNIIRVGDWVRIVTPKIVTRVGYPKSVKDYMPTAKALFEAELKKHLGGMVIDRILHDIAYGLAKSNGFGGNERSLHLEDQPQIMGQEFCVSGVRMVQTGTYYPPSYWTSYYGEHDWEPGGLADMKSRRLLSGFGLGQLVDIDKRIEIPTEHVEKITR